MAIRIFAAILFFILAVMLALLNLDALLNEEPSIEARLLPNSSITYHDKEIVFVRRLPGKIATDIDVNNNCSSSFVKPKSIQGKIQLDVAVLTATGSSSGSQEPVCVVIRNYYNLDDVRVYIREFRSSKNDVVMNLSINRSIFSNIVHIVVDNAAVLCFGVATALAVEIILFRRDDGEGKPRDPNNQELLES